MTIEDRWIPSVLFAAVEEGEFTVHPKAALSLVEIAKLEQEVIAGFLPRKEREPFSLKIV
jgi:hypothetical protein